MSEAKVDTVRLQGLARAYTASATLFAALDLDLFTHVAAGCDTDEKLASAMNILPLNAERLIAACAALGLVTRGSDGVLANAPDSQRFLVRNTPDYAGAWMNFTRPDVPGWFRLSEYLRATASPTVLGMYADLTVEQARAYHAATFSVGMGAGKRFAREVDLTGRRRLLDLGGGSGAYSINAVRRYCGLSAVVFDLPPVIEVAKEYLARAGVADRVTTVAGDFTRDVLPGGVDAVVMASNLPIYDGAVIATVLRRALAALLPGGEMHLVGEMLDDDGTGPADAAMWGLAEALTGGGGRAHTVADCRRYFATSGFVDIADSPFVPGVLHRVSGLKATG